MFGKYHLFAVFVVLTVLINGNYWTIDFLLSKDEAIVCFEYVQNLFTFFSFFIQFFLVSTSVKTCGENQIHCTGCNPCLSGQKSCEQLESSSSGATACPFNCQQSSDCCMCAPGSYTNSEGKCVPPSQCGY